MTLVAIVVDLGFGDAGKGLLTDHLVRRLGARTVVRFNGGAQAGHNVVAPDGTHHCFSQIGAGMLVPGVRAFLSRDVVIDPLALRIEADALARKIGESPLPRLAIDADARVITPYHRAANQLREIARGALAHGSCGIGFGETVHDDLTHPDETIRAHELISSNELRRKLERVRERKRIELETWLAERGWEPFGEDVVREWDVLIDPSLGERWIDLVVPFARALMLRDEQLLRRWLSEAPAIFEGAQGVLLDEWHGFAPHTTWSTCTFAPALALLRTVAPRVEPVRYGVLRTHAVRHGAGPLPTETRALDAHVREHNRPHRFQGSVRYGWFDAVLARYALEVVGGVDHLAITHVDLAARTRLFACGHYREGAARLDRLPVGEVGDLASQEALTLRLQQVEPELAALPEPPEAMIEAVEDLLAREISLASHGPTTSHVVHRRAVPSSHPGTLPRGATAIE